MGCFSNYKSHEEEILKIKYFDYEITIKEEWNINDDFQDTLSFPQESKGSNVSNKVKSDFKDEGYKPYKCTKCDNAFEFNNDVLLHIQVTHENKRPFECSK